LFVIMIDFSACEKFSLPPKDHNTVFSPPQRLGARETHAY
jgi:hypothetical protein